MSDASGTNLMDVAGRRWSQEILEALSIDPSLLPRLCESPEITGNVHSHAALSTGLAEGTPVVGGAGDNAATAIGTGVIAQRKSFVTIGTSGVIFAHSDSVVIDPKGRVHTFCAAIPNTWTVMSCTLAAGLSLRWMRSILFSAEQLTASHPEISSYAVIDEMAAAVPIGANRLIYLPYLLGERSPILDESARGVFFGLSAIHQKQDLLRAVMEGVAFSIRNCFDVLMEMGLSFEELMITGGGGRSLLWRQIIADLCECPVIAPENCDGAVLGAAILAGVGTRMYSSLGEACEQVVKLRHTQYPILENTILYRPYYELYLQLYPQLKDCFKHLSELPGKPIAGG
jgi:xylulokinase